MTECLLMALSGHFYRGPQKGMSALPQKADMTVPAPRLALLEKGVEKRLGWLAMTGEENKP
jgi:hypothetical protein